MADDAPVPAPDPQPIAADWAALNVLLAPVEDPFVRAAGDAIGADLRARGEPFASSPEGKFLGLIGAMTSCYLRADKDDEPLGPMSIGPDGRTFIPSDVSPAQRDALAADLANCSHHDLRARVGDCLWLAHRDHRSARLAASAYIAVAESCFDSRIDDDIAWSQAEERLRRGLKLAKNVRDDDAVTAGQALLSRIVSTLRDTEASSVCADAFLIQLEHRLADPAAIAADAAAIARRLGESANHDESVRYWHVAVRAAERSPDETAKKAARLSLAQALHRYAEAVEPDGGQYPAVLERMYAEALEAYRKAGAPDDVKEAMHRKVLEMEKRVAGTVGTISVPFDPSDMFKALRRAFDGKSLADCLHLLALGIVKIPDEAALKERVLRQLRESPLMAMIPMMTVDKDGRRRGVVDGLDPHGEDVASSATRDQIGSTSGAASLSRTRRLPSPSGTILHPAGIGPPVQRPVAIRWRTPCLMRSAITSRSHWATEPSRCSSRRPIGVSVAICSVT